MCLTLIRNTARAIYERRLSLSEEQWTALTTSQVGPLGRYFESLVGTVFAVSPDIETAYFNVPVREGATTKGEFDVLFKWRGIWHHLEMAIKYYIGVGDCTDPYNWHGPALRDNLGRKWHHMKSQQLKLADTPAAARVLKALGVSDLIREPLLLGRLFHPYDTWQESRFRIPKGVSDGHPKGWWRHAGDVKPPSGTYWMPLTKAEWLSPVCGDMTEILATRPPSDLIRPTQFAVLAPSNNGKFVEIERGFVVPDDWGQTLGIGQVS